MQVLVGRIETLFRFLAGTRPPSDPRPSDPLKGMTVEKFGDAAVLVFSRNGDMHPDRIINAFDALKARGTDPIAIVGDTSVIAPLLRSGEPTRLLTYSPNHDANTILREQVLPAAIAGDQTARNIYQMARLINPDDIPGARKVAIIAELAEFRNQFVLTQAHLGEQKLPLGASFELLPQDKEDVFVEFAVIHEVPTHWQAMKLFEMARDQSEIPVQVISTGSWEFAATIGSFYPMDPRALGRHALRIAPKIFDEILQLHILTDYLESSGIELKASAKISLFDRLIPRSATGEMQERCSPWEFTKSRDFQLIDSIRDQLNQSGLTLAPEKRGTILTRVFYDASPEERLKVEIARATAARDHSEKKQKPKGRESGGEK